jgi:hypothetical protein
VPDAEIRNGGMPAPTKVVANVGSVEKPQEIHHASVAKKKTQEHEYIFFALGQL